MFVYNEKIRISIEIPQINKMVICMHIFICNIIYIINIIYYRIMCMNECIYLPNIGYNNRRDTQKLCLAYTCNE